MYKITSFQKLPKSSVEIKFEIDKEEIAKQRPSVLKKLASESSLPGFRPGKVPTEMIEKRLGETGILEEAVEEVIRDVYPKILEEKKLFPLGRPHIAITRLEADKDAEVLIKIDVYPDITLPDYKKLSSSIMSRKDDTDVTEKEINEAAAEIKKYSQRGDEKKEGETEDAELTDDFVKTLGDFKDVADFKKKLKENLGKEKEIRAKEKKRSDTIEKIVEESKLEVPEVLVEEELNKMMNEFSGELERGGFTLDQYTKQVGKTEESIRTDWREKAEARVKGEIILMEIAKTENIKAPEEKIHEEAHKLLAQYPEADSARVHAFVEDLLLKEEVFKFLEAQK